MLVDFLLFGLFAVLLVPTICAYYAHSRGRSFWLWFAIGTFLPIISYFILLLLPDKSNPLEEDLKELRVKNKMLGTVSEVPIDDPIKKAAERAPIREIAFKANTNSNSGQKTLEVLIDKEPLIDFVKKVEQPYAQAEGLPNLAGCYQNVPLTLALSPYKHFLGEPSRRYSREGKAMVLIGDESFSADVRKEWSLSVKISLYRRLVVWHSFSQQTKSKWGYFEPELLVFSRYQYEEALQELSQCVRED